MDPPWNIALEVAGPASTMTYQIIRSQSPEPSSGFLQTGTFLPTGAARHRPGALNQRFAMSSLLLIRLLCAGHRYTGMHEAIKLQVGYSEFGL